MIFFTKRANYAMCALTQRFRVLAVDDSALARKLVDTALGAINTNF